MATETTTAQRTARLPRRAVPALLAAMGAWLALAPLAPARAWHLPWHHAAHPHPVAAVQALRISVDGSAAGSAAAVTQSWERNTLLLDLTQLGSEGAATLTPPPDQGWPVRLAFRVRPGSMADLEVAGAQRVLFTVPRSGAALTLRLDPGVYVLKTPSLRLRWSAAADLPR